MEDRRRKSLINWPYQPTHSPSYCEQHVRLSSYWGHRSSMTLALTNCGMGNKLLCHVMDKSETPSSDDIAVTEICR